MFRQILLLFPPVGHGLPYPHLAIPSLLAYLQKDGYHDVRSLDLTDYVPSRGKSFFHRHLLAEVFRQRQNDAGHLLRSYKVASEGKPRSLYDLSKLIAMDRRVKLIGLSLVYPQQVPISLALAKYIRSMTERVKLICGGPMVTANIADYVTQDNFHDFECLIAGDGEEPLLSIARGLTTRVVDFSRIPNCYYRTNGSFSFSGRQFTMRPEDYLTPVFADRKFARLPLRTSKGCFWRKCAFCTYRAVYEGYIGPNVHRVVRHISELRRRHDTNRFVLVDDAMAAKVLYQFAKTLLEQKMDIRWNCSAMFEKHFCEPEVARTLSVAGCNTIFFGLESASERVLRLMRKPHRLDTAIRVLDNLSRYGIRPHLNVMIGFPTETMAEAQETIDFLKRHRRIYDNFSLQKFSLERKSEVWNSPSTFGIHRIDEAHDENVSGRIGVEFAALSGMNARQRHYMTLRGLAVYRKPGTSIMAYLKRKAESAAYFVANRREIVQEN